MTNAGWLSRYVTESGREPTNAVYQRGDHSLVTDASRVLVVRGAAGLPVGAMQRPGVGNLLSNLVALSPPPDAARTTLGDLWAWLDRVEREGCDECGNTGGFYYPAERSTVRCHDCNGRGWAFPDRAEWDADSVVVAGELLMRNHVAWWMPAELGETGSPVAIWRHVIGTKTPSVVFAGPDWKLVVVAQTAQGTLKKYRTYTPGAGQWYEARRQFADKSVHPGTDWFVESGFDPRDLVKMWGEQPQPKKRKARAK